MGRFVRPGARVLLKPNFVRGRRAEEAANTHPVFVTEVARLVREAGGEPIVGDSPALGSAWGVAKRCGLLDLARANGIPIVEFRKTRKIASPRGDGRSLRLAEAALSADVVINLPKFKAHGQTYLTLAVKNMFGCVKGRRKALFHFLLGEQPMDFARMLVDVARAVGPALTLLDGVVGLERTGPMGGDPRPLGLIVAGTDCAAIDAVACGIVGAEPERLLTLRAAREAGAGETDLSRIRILSAERGEIAAADLRSLSPHLAERPFVLPERLSPLLFSPLRLARGLVRQAWALLGPAGGEKEGGNH